MVEEVDIFQSLAALAGLDEPKGVEGRSFLPLLEDVQPRWTQRAFWQYRHYWDANKSNVMGYTIRTEAYRYTAWARQECNFMEPMKNCASAADARPNWDLIYGEELYDHKGETYASGVNDWNNENENLAYRPEYAGQLAKLRNELIAHWHAVDASQETQMSVLCKCCGISRLQHALCGAWIMMVRCAAMEPVVLRAPATASSSCSLCCCFGGSAAMHSSKRSFAAIECQCSRLHGLLLCSV